MNRAKRKKGNLETKKQNSHFYLINCGFKWGIEVTNFHFYLIESGNLSRNTRYPKIPI